MKKIFLCLALGALFFNSCNSDDDDETVQVDIETQNSYDDLAAEKYLEEHYFDARGNVVAFDEDDTSDDNNTKLADLAVTLPSGVIYVVRPAAQPEPGTVIGDTDIITLMLSSTTYVATKTDDVVSFSSASTFMNTITGTGVPVVDPAFYYVKQSVLDDATTDAAKLRSYYEIEGLREGLQYFKAYDISDEADYNLQGVIIVPSRAAFARDSHYNYTGLSYTDRSFVFNFQVYKTAPRS
ncbi:MAG: hypothetical protein QM564_14050 [Bergeyella sp.]